MKSKTILVLSLAILAGTALYPTSSWGMERDDHKAPSFMPSSQSSANTASQHAKLSEEDPYLDTQQNPLRSSSPTPSKRVRAVRLSPLALKLAAHNGKHGRKGAESQRAKHQKNQADLPATPQNPPSPLDAKAVPAHAALSEEDLFLDAQQNPQNPLRNSSPTPSKRVGAVRLSLLALKLAAHNGKHGRKGAESQRAKHQKNQADLPATPQNPPSPLDAKAVPAHAALSEEDLFLDAQQNPLRNSSPTPSKRVGAVRLSLLALKLAAHNGKHGRKGAESRRAKHQKNQADLPATPQNPSSPLDAKAVPAHAALSEEDLFLDAHLIPQGPSAEHLPESSSSTLPQEPSAEQLEDFIAREKEKVRVNTEAETQAELEKEKKYMEAKNSPEAKAARVFVAKLLAEAGPLESTPMSPGTLPRVLDHPIDNPIHRRIKFTYQDVLEHISKSSVPWQYDIRYLRSKEGKQEIERHIKNYNNFPTHNCGKRPLGPQALRPTWYERFKDCGPEYCMSVLATELMEEYYGRNPTARDQWIQKSEQLKEKYRASNPPDAPSFD